MRGVAKNEQNNCSPFRGLQNSIRHTISPQLMAQHHNMLAWKPQITPQSRVFCHLAHSWIFSRGPQESLASDWMKARDPDP